MKRAVVVAMLIAMTGAMGCAWTWQQRLPGGLESYRTDSMPRCSTSKGWAAADGVLAGLHALTIVLAASSEEPIDNSGAIIVGNVVAVLVHTASAIKGVSWAGDCRRAHEEWNVVDAASSRGPEEDGKRLALERAGNHLNDPRKARAFWCAASTGDCVIDQSACADGCSRQDTAWCTAGKGGFVCNRTRAGCQAVRYSRRSRNMGECVEHRAGLAHLPAGASPAGEPAPSPPPPSAPSPPPSPSSPPSPPSP